MPPRLAPFVTRAVAVLAVGLLLWAAAVASGHPALDAGIFEFGRTKSFAGTVVEQPYPAVRLDGEEMVGHPIPLLVAPGKHGADALVRWRNGRHVTFTGTRIQRNGHLMIEVQVDSLESGTPEHKAAVVPVHSIDASHTDPVQLTGEIVDSKCFLGMMVPGSGKTHKECASLCIRRGIPAALFVQDRRGQSALLLLMGASGESVAAQATEAAGEAITVTGIVRRQDGWLVPRTDPASWRRLAR